MSFDAFLLCFALKYHWSLIWVSRDYFRPPTSHKKNYRKEMDIIFIIMLTKSDVVDPG